MSRMKQAIVGSALGPAEFPEPGTAERRYRFADSFVGFDGHFPGFPVLPALVQVLTAVTVAEALQGRPLEVSSMENAKFLLQIQPDTEVSVRCRAHPTPESCSVDVKVCVPKGVAASFRLNVSPAGETP